MRRPSEDELIATYFAPLAGPGSFGLRDDAAVLVQKPGVDIVVTKDMVVSGVHFFPEDPPGAVARKALRVNLSDLAAKGAEPCGFLLCLALPEDWTEDWLAGFAQGLGEDAASYKCPLLGGDTTRIPGPLAISITAFGTVPADRMILRGGVAADDLIYVTGTIGDAALGLKFRQDGASDAEWTRAVDPQAAAYLASRYLLPQPRLALCSALRAHAHAAMDVSDGLVGDLSKMLRLTGMTIEVMTADVPLSAAAADILKKMPSFAETILTGGDDYEILCSIPPLQGAGFEALASSAGLSVRAIGVAKPGLAPPNFRDKEGRALVFAQPSFRHF